MHPGVIGVSMPDYPEPPSIILYAGDDVPSVNVNSYYKTEDIKFQDVNCVKLLKEMETKPYSEWHDNSASEGDIICIFNNNKYYKIKFRNVNYYSTDAVANYVIEETRNSGNKIQASRYYGDRETPYAYFDCPPQYPKCSLALMTKDGTTILSSDCLGGQKCEVLGTEHGDVYDDTYGWENLKWQAVGYPQQLIITPTIPVSYTVGTIEIPVNVKYLSGEPAIGIGVTGKIKKDILTVAEDYRITNADGNVNLIFENFNEPGTYTAEIRASDPLKGLETTITRPITVKAKLESHFYAEPVQYNNNPIKISAQFKDSAGAAVSLDKFIVTATLTTPSTVMDLPTSVNVLAPGSYEVYINTDRVGVMDIHIEYGKTGFAWATEDIQIQIKKPFIKFVHNLPLEHTIGSYDFVVQTFNPQNELIDVDLTCEVTEPSYLKSDLDMRRVTKGKYVNYYDFYEEGIYYFKCYANKLGYDTGTLEQSVTIYPKAPIPFIPDIWTILTVLLPLAGGGYMLYKVYKRVRK